MLGRPVRLQLAGGREKKEGVGPACQGAPPVRTKAKRYLGKSSSPAQRTQASESTGRRAVLGELTGAAATGGEGAGRRREVFSATSSRCGAGGSTRLLGTRGDLRSRRGRRARLRAWERGRCCLGRCWGWWESFQGRMADFYRREREHRRCPVAASTPCVSAVGGARRGSGVGGGLLRDVACCWRDGRGRDGLVQRGTRKVCWCVLLFSSMSHGRGLGRGDWGSTARRQGRSTGTAMGLGRTGGLLATVFALLLNPAH
jgi:hypothetical protein